MPILKSSPMHQAHNNMTDLSTNILSKKLANPLPGRSEETKSNMCLVLQYCRVALLCHDPLQLAVEPCKFEKQMEYLANNLNVISIDEMKQHLESTTPFNEKTVVITFDGGYADVLYTAKEVLEKYQVPATVFAASANIPEVRQFWWNTLENFLIAGDSQDQLEIEIDGHLYVWSLMNQHNRFRAYDDLYSILSDKNPLEQEAIIKQINHISDFQADELDNYRTMGVQELIKLEEGGFITIGGHTHNYVKLSSLPKWQQIEEISKNKEILEEILGHSIEYFSYPFGNDNSSTAETFDMLENCGFSMACGNSYGTVSISDRTNRYDIPRIKIGNWNPFTFDRFLRGFQAN